MGWSKKKAAQCLTLLAVALSLTGCGKPQYVGNSAKGFWSESSSPISPNMAFQKAMPFLEATWVARCEKVHNHDEWCDKPPLDHMVLVGNTYYVTRTSYPYKTYSAFTSYAVRVNADSGEVTPLD